MDSGPAAATESGAPRSSGVSTAAPVPAMIADTPLAALTGSTDSSVAPPAVSLTGLSGSAGAGATQPRGVLGSSDEGRGAVLGLGVPPVFQQPPVVIPQTMGQRVFYTGAVLGAVSPMVQNIRLSSSLISVPGEMDRQDASTIMAIDAGTTQASPLSPETPVGDTAGTPESGTTITPLSAELPALPPGMFPVAGETTAALLDSQPELPAAEAGIDSTSSLAVLAGSVAGARRIQWNLPDPAATRKGRRASSRRAA
jgi:hypothetical protein